MEKERRKEESVISVCTHRRRDKKSVTLPIFFFFFELSLLLFCSRCVIRFGNARPALKLPDALSAFVRKSIESLKCYSALIKV